MELKREAVDNPMVEASGSNTRNSAGNRLAEEYEVANSNNLNGQRAQSFLRGTSAFNLRNNARYLPLENMVGSSLGDQVPLTRREEQSTQSILRETSASNLPNSVSVSLQLGNMAEERLRIRVPITRVRRRRRGNTRDEEFEALTDYRETSASNLRNSVSDPLQLGNMAEERRQIRVLFTRVRRRRGNARDEEFEALTDLRETSASNLRNSVSVPLQLGNMAGVRVQIQVPCTRDRRRGNARDEEFEALTEGLRETIAQQMEFLREEHELRLEVLKAKLMAQQERARAKIARRQYYEALNANISG